MALLSDLVAAIAAVEGVEESFVTGVARYLREAGLISQAGRGRGAAKMTFADGAALLIGVNATTLAKDAPEIVRELLSFKWKDQRIENGIDADVIKERSDDLFDWVLQRTDHGFRDRGTLGVFLERLIYSALPVSNGESRLSSATSSADVTFLITFCKPSKSVEFRYSYYTEYFDDNGDVKDIEGDIFEIGEFSSLTDSTSQQGDRSERVSITQRTIMEVGRVLAS